MTEQDVQLPKGYEDKGEGFKRAFAHAKEHNNPDKAALQYAEKWQDDFEPVEEEKAGGGKA
jgi:hypothetical protein